MNIFYILGFSLVFILNYIDLSSQSDRSRTTDLDSRISRGRPSKRRSPDTTLTLAMPHHSTTFSPAADTSSRPTSVHSSISFAEPPPRSIAEPSRVVAEPTSRRFAEPSSRRVSESSSRRVAESSARRVAESSSRRVAGSSSRRFAEPSPRYVAEPSHYFAQPSPNIAAYNGPPFDMPPFDRRSPDTTLTLATPDSVERARSRSPETTRNQSPSIFGFKLKELPFLRLISYSNPVWCFELRTFTFPQMSIVQFVPKHQTYIPVPSEKQIVLSNSHGDVFAFLNETENGSIAFRLYTRKSKKHLPVKINMQSGAIGALSSSEIESCPLDNQTPLIYKFEIIHTEKAVRMRTNRFPNDRRN